MTDDRSSLPAFNARPPRPGWGIRPMPRKTLSLKQPIRVMPPPTKVVIPIHQCLGMDARPLVSVGNRVQTGQPIAAAIDADNGQQQGPLIHTSITGVVAAIENRAVTGLAGDDYPCIVIEGDGTDQPWPGYDALGDPLELPPDKLCAQVEMAGIVGLGGALYSTADKLRTRQPIDILIINGAECEPYITCDEILMRERATDIARGTRIMLRALSTPLAVVAVESDMPEARVALVDAIEAEGCDDIRIAVVTAKYPAGGERQLIELITEREVPENGLPADVGVLCHNVGTAAAVADLYDRHRPLISRIVTLTGRGIATPANFDARIGTPLRDLFAAADGLNDDVSHLIMGGPMMGITLADDSLPVTKATNCIIVMQTGDVSPLREEMPCIRCGECIQVCPARLLPQELLTTTRRQDMAALNEFGLDACIECGCCDYVCPSQIRLTGRFIEAKTVLRRHHQDQQRAARARERFEAREARLAAQDEQQAAALNEQSAAGRDELDALLARTRDQGPSA